MCWNEFEPKMASTKDILPYERDEIGKVLEEQRVDIRNTISKRFLGGLPEAPAEQYMGRWISWIKASEGETGSNAYIADPRRSNQASIDKINDEGENLLENGKLNVDEKNFEGDVSSSSSVASYIGSMIASLRKLDKIGLVISENDTKIVVTNILEQAVSNAGSIDAQIQKEWKSPIVDKNGSIAWVKFVFTLTNSIRDSFYSGSQTLRIKVQSNYFSFANDKDSK